MAGRRHWLGRKADVDCEHSHDKEQERGRRELNATVRQFRCAERSGGDADGEEEIDRDLDVDASADA